MNKPAVGVKLSLVDRGSVAFKAAQRDGMVVLAPYTHCALRLLSNAAGRVDQVHSNSRSSPAEDTRRGAGEACLSGEPGRSWVSLKAGYP